jgi:hypothetical protein
MSEDYLLRHIQGRPSQCYQSAEPSDIDLAMHVLPAFENKEMVCYLALQPLVDVRGLSGF